MNEKLDVLTVELKGMSDAVGRVQRAAADMRHEYSKLEKQAEMTETLRIELEKLKDRFTKITSFVSGAY